jgi:hypothetical protein
MPLVVDSRLNSRSRVTGSDNLLHLRVDLRDRATSSQTLLEGRVLSVVP